MTLVRCQEKSENFSQARANWSNSRFIAQVEPITRDRDELIGRLLLRGGGVGAVATARAALRSLGPSAPAAPAEIAACDKHERDDECQLQTHPPPQAVPTW